MRVSGWHWRSHGTVASPIMALNPELSITRMMGPRVFRIIPPRVPAA